MGKTRKVCFSVYFAFSPTTFQALSIIIDKGPSFTKVKHEILLLFSCVQVIISPLGKIIK